MNRHIIDYDQTFLLRVFFNVLRNTLEEVWRPICKEVNVAAPRTEVLRLLLRRFTQDPNDVENTFPNSVHELIQKKGFPAFASSRHPD